MPRFSPLPRFPIADWHTTIAGELDIPFFVSKFAWPHLVQRGGGVIVNVVSMAGQIAGEFPPMVAHAAANAGVIGMTPTGVGGSPSRNSRRGCQPGPGTDSRERTRPGRRPDRQGRDHEEDPAQCFARPEEIVDLVVFQARTSPAPTTWSTAARPPGDLPPPCALGMRLNRNMLTGVA
ncbi:SDR family oxidoreductase [Herbidospora cretacea]|uniref:SDR family NAD(P)-dependent oxidoreductase n=1 Tax=Herbidospora cretacea TaxID=28444 RepID=UPI0009DFA32F